ncbi:dTDP-4-dehydrorhamnose 3,5-epimerase [Opitutaceae bacterium TAV4]|nr:dTDP-4-dehydrorhamnose 3,5-epimerase [Opitutaceae bacterium TAV4]RRJ94501.1 dTDP-4-dehydrorhamnose 3,5-epimerase [Opitutaceae bacterium TAV4]RRJ98562.1 dTDP-4-dehydrorhamnose 3,5-epimerase [Opitutaceae bacterium TAV3]
MTSLSQPFLGAHLLKPKVFEDARGDFVKTFHSGAFAELGIPFAPAEEFFSTSRKGVLRGMHFQLPPHDHAKLVYCIRGRVLDVLVDLRKTSPTYRQVASAELSCENHHQFYIPSGVAHGFLALEDNSVMVYKTTTVYAPSHDAGIRWDSFDFNWGTTAPIISPRDTAFSPLADFVSPF